MKTPDEIKRNIITCMELNMEYFMPGATQKAFGDALALIQQLEAERDELIEAIKEWSPFDAFPLPCKFCKNVKEAFCGEKCKWCREYNNFEWHGVQKEETP